MRADVAIRRSKSARQRFRMGRRGRWIASLLVFNGAWTCLVLF